MRTLDERCGTKTCPIRARCAKCVSESSEEESLSLGCEMWTPVHGWDHTPAEQAVKRALKEG